MTHKVYLIKHIDTGKGYVGITAGDLYTRWYQHGHDTASAVYKALRSEGHRMTMELLAEYEDRDDALEAEQRFIHELNTAEPNGWNRYVKPVKIANASKLKQYIKVVGSPKFASNNEFMICPICDYPEHIHTEDVEVFNRTGEDSESGLHVRISELTLMQDASMLGNPSGRRQGIRIFFMCEECHNDWVGFDSNGEEMYRQIPPRYEFLIWQRKGITYTEVVYYVEDKS